MPSVIVDQPTTMTDKPLFDVKRIKDKCDTTYAKRWASMETELVALVQAAMEEAAAADETQCSIDLQAFIERFEDDLGENWFDHFCNTIEKKFSRDGLTAFMDSTCLIMRGWAEGGEDDECDGGGGRTLTNPEQR